MIFPFILHRNPGSKSRNSFTIILTRVVVLVIVILLLVLALALPVVVTAAIAIAIAKAVTVAVAVMIIIVVVVVVLGRALCKLCRTMPYWDVFCASFVVRSSTGTCFVQAYGYI